MTNATQQATKTQYCLPEWDLSDFYSSMESPKIQEDLKKAKDLTHQFATSYEGVFTNEGNWSGEQFFQAVADYEIIDEVLTKLLSYGYLCYATQLNTPSVLQFFQMIQEESTNISSNLIFFTLELNALDDNRLEKAYEQSSNLHRYKPWIDSVRLFRSHQLSSDLEKLIHEKSVTGRNAWIRLYDETLASMTFHFKKTEITLAEVLNHFSSKDPETRRQAAFSLSEGLKKNLSILTLVTNTLAKDKEIEDRWRKYKHPVAARNLSNQVEDDVVEALASTVKQFYPTLSHRYYALKAKWLGCSQIDYWDRNAPLPEANDAQIEWGEAKEIVLQSYNRFSPDLAAIGTHFFENNWIDVAPKPGKESGAFSHPTVPSVHPYILLNYQGRLRDVMVLAHELGHGIHQVLAGKQGPLLSSTPLTIAETASVFGEMLTFQALLEKTTPTQRRSLIAAKVEDMLNTVVRQIAFYDFEKQVHNRRLQGELTADDFAELWMLTQNQALGPAVRLDPIIAPYWSYISHFVHAPFYVYAYAFGDCLVNSLYAVYQSGHSGFTEKYIDLLKAGGTKRYPDLLAPFGLDAKNPVFWEKGLNILQGLIDELEKLD